MIQPLSPPPILIWYGDAPSTSPLLQVAGLSLVKRAVLASGKAGIERALVAVRPANLSAVQRELQDPRISLSVKVVSVDTDLTNDVGAAPEWIVVGGDHVWLPDVLSAMTEPLAAGSDLRTLAGEADSDPISLARVRSPLLESLLRPGEQRSRSGERVAVPGGYQRVSAEQGAAAAERMLVAALGKPADGVISRNINRKISTAISRRLAPFPVRPNHVTLVVLLLGLAAWPLGWRGDYIGIALAGLCYYVSAILDGVDGELARLKYMGSPLGTWFDTVSDDLVGAAFLVGMYGGLHRTATHDLWGWYGAATIVAYIAALAPRYFILVALGDGNHQTLAARRKAQRARSPIARFFVEVVARTDFLPFYAFVTAILGVVQVFAVTFGVGAVFGVVDTVSTVRRFKAETGKG